MGGDHGPTVTVPAAMDALAEHPQLRLILVGDQHAIQNVLKDSKKRRLIAMGDSSYLRNGDDG